MVSEVNNNSGLTLATLKSRLENFSELTGASSKPVPNAQQNNGLVSFKYQDSFEPVKGNFEILSFAKNMKGANEYIGALQTASSVLKKMDKAISDGANDATLNDIATNSKFLGNAIFDKTLVVSIGKNEFSFTLQNPTSLPNAQRQDYIATTRNEINATLSKVSDAISSPDITPSVPVNGQGFNFEEFDAQAFKKMF